MYIIGYFLIACQTFAIAYYIWQCYNIYYE